MTPPTSRPGAPVIRPISHGGVRYEARPSQAGVLFAVDEQTGTSVWQVELEKYRADRGVRAAAIQSMTLSEGGEAIELEDEGGLRYDIDLEARTATLRTWPVQLVLVDARPGTEGWSYRVRVEVANPLARVVKLDGPSVGEGGTLWNDLFDVKVDGREVDYHGNMAKRAPPSRFIELAPGTAWRTEIELGEAYPVAAGAHRVEVTFEHTNHFSPDDFVLTSKPLAFDVPAR